MKKTLTALLFAFALNGVMAQQKPTREDVMQLLEFSGRMKIFENLREGLIEDAEAKYILTRRQKKRFTAEVDTAIKEGLDKFADFYISEYTKQEIEEMIAQSKNAIGKKVRNNADKYIAFKNQWKQDLGHSIESAVTKAMGLPPESNH